MASTRRFPVEAGHIMMFARAIGDPNPIYADPDHAATTEAGSILAPPTFVQASAQFDPDYPLRPTVGEPWFGSGREATGTPERDFGGTGLHAEQEFTYHRHPRPGDVLTVHVAPGKSWKKQGRKGGELTFRETITEYRDPDGETVVTARSVSVQTEKVVE